MTNLVAHRRASHLLTTPWRTRLEKRQGRQVVAEASDPRRSTIATRRVTHELRGVPREIHSIDEDKWYLVGWTIRSPDRDSVLIGAGTSGLGHLQGHCQHLVTPDAMRILRAACPVPEDRRLIWRRFAMLLASRQCCVCF